jgi:hypothetical protein
MQMDASAAADLRYPWSAERPDPEGRNIMKATRVMRGKNIFRK